MLTAQTCDTEKNLKDDALIIDFKETKLKKRFNSHRSKDKINFTPSSVFIPAITKGVACLST